MDDILSFIGKTLISVVVTLLALLLINTFTGYLARGVVKEFKKELFYQLLETQIVGERGGEKLNIYGISEKKPD